MPETLAVISQSGSSLSFFNTATGERTAHLSNLVSEPHELCYDDRAGLLYITHAYASGWYVSHGEALSQISVVDVGEREVVDVIDISPGRGVHYHVLDKERDMLWACVEEGLGEGPRDGGMVGIDLKTKKVVKMIPSGWKSHWFVMMPDGRKAYTCNKEAEFSTVIDLEGGAVKGRISMPHGSEQPSISPDGRLAFFPTPTIGVGMKWKSGFAVQVVDTRTDEIVHTIPLEHGALTTHVTSTNLLLVGQYAFDPPSPGSSIPTPLNGCLSVFASQAEGFRKLGEVEVGKASLTITSSPDGTRAFVANQWSGTVTVVDLERMEAERTLEVDTVMPAGSGMLNGAHGMAVISS